MSRMGLEGQLEAAAQEFVKKILMILRSASLADVAGVGVGGGSAAAGASPAARTPRFSPPRGPGRPRAARSTAEAPADLIPKVLDVLAAAHEPMPARAIADQLGVSLDALAKPLTQLRADGRIEKQGEKRASKYLVAR